MKTRRRFFEPVEDDVRASRPVRDLQLTRPGVGQRCPDTIGVWTSDVNAEQHGATRDVLLQRLGAIGRHAGAHQHRREAAGCMPSRLAELRRKWAPGNDGSNPGEDEGDGGDEAAGQFSQTSRRPRIFELGTRRGIHPLGKRTGFDVIPCDDRDGLPLDTQTM